MAKKTQKQNNKAKAVKEIEKMLPSGAQKMPPEVAGNMKKLKEKLDKLSKRILEKFDKYIVGIALMPPEKKEGQEKPDTSKIKVLVLVDDSDSKKMSKAELHDKISRIIGTIAEEIDKALSPETMLLSELKEMCYDGKYEILKTISLSAPLYDPSDLLAAIRIAEVHKTMVLQKFEKYIVSYVAAGSLFRGEKSNDIDVYVIIDDTDVKKMSRAELKDKLRAIIVGMGLEASKITGVQKAFHIQTYILTDFWDNLKDANPIIFTLLRDGVPLFDRGVFMPWKLLLKMGRIKPSREAIEMNMELGGRLIERTRFKLLSVLGEDLYYAVLNPAQAALMLYGIPPPTPKETIKLMDEIFVKKEKLLQKKYVDTLEKVRAAYKNIEHGKMKEVSGKYIDDLLKEAKEYLKAIKELFKKIEEKTEKASILDVYDSCITLARDLLVPHGIKKVTESTVEALFKEKLVEEEKVPEKFLRILGEVIKAKKDFQNQKITRQEVEKVRKDARLFVKAMVEHLQRKKLNALERVKIRFKYGENKVGEAVVLGKIAFIVPDLTDRDEVLKAEVKDRRLVNPKKALLEDMEKGITEGIPSKIFINHNTFEDLKNIIGKDIEIILG